MAWSLGVAAPGRDHHDPEPAIRPATGQAGDSMTEIPDRRTTGARSLIPPGMTGPRLPGCRVRRRP